MYSQDALIDIHTRVHRSLQGLLDHCAEFSDEELQRKLDGFGYPEIRLQLHHMIGAEEYWFGVLRGLMLTEEREEDYADMEALRSYRARVADTTAAYLQDTPNPVLNEPATFKTWKKTATLIPAHVLLRTQTHIFQHQGQVAAMARLLGRPIPPGLDFPLDPGSGS